jgi:hypothetical protein
MTERSCLSVNQFLLSEPAWRIVQIVTSYLLTSVAYWARFFTLSQLISLWQVFGPLNNTDR